MDNAISVILLGTSKLLYKCAEEVEKFYDNRVFLRVIDVAYSPMKKKFKEKYGNVDEFKTKSEIFDWLQDVPTPTYLLSVNNPYIIPKRVCDNTNLTLINLHHSLLPKHPGRNAEAWTIFDNDEYGGITWHYIAPGVDDGAIICQRSHRLDEDITSLKLLKECEELALSGLRTEIIPFEKLEREKATEQPAEQNRITLAKDIPNNGYLDMRWSAEKISAFLRAMDYGASPVLGRPKICIWENDYIIRKYQIRNGILSANAQDKTSVEEQVVTIIKDNAEITLYLKKI